MCHNRCGEWTQAVLWGEVMPHVSWADVPLCPVVYVTYQHDRNQCDRLKWCLQRESFSDWALKQVLQASLMSATSDSFTECPPFARLIASDKYMYSEHELVRMCNACNLHDTDQTMVVHGTLPHKRRWRHSSACGM
mgnify:CR=1 FL=1